GNVVYAVAPQRHNINHTFGRDAKNFLDLGRVADQIVFRRVKHQDAIVHELQHIFVAGDYVHQIGLRGSFFRQRTDDVIGFIAAKLENRNAIGLERSPNIGQLLRQIARHLTSVGFVTWLFNFLEFLSFKLELAYSLDLPSCLVAKGGAATSKTAAKYSNRKGV